MNQGFHAKTSSLHHLRYIFSISMSNVSLGKSKRESGNNSSEELWKAVVSHSVRNEVHNISINKV